MDGTTDPVETLIFAQHGWADDNRAMQQLGQALAGPRTQVVAPKLGYVRTWLRIEPLIQIVEHAAEEALATYPDARLRIVGHSMGGLIWIELLTRHPEWLVRTDRLVLIGSPVGGAELAGVLDPLGLTIARDLRVDRRARAEAIAAVVPTLTVIGGRLGAHDGTVSHESARLQNARFVLVPTASHASSRYDPWITRLVDAFFSNPWLPVDLDALVSRIEALPGIRSAEPHLHRMLRLAQVVVMLPDGTTIRTLNAVPGLLLVFVADGEGRCHYAGLVPRKGRPALHELLEEVRAQHYPAAPNA